MPDDMALVAARSGGDDDVTRSLTVGEKLLARMTFMYGLNPDIVHIHNRAYSIF